MDVQSTVKPWEAESAGKGNTAPVGWRKITEKEFAQSKFFSYSPDHMEYRQLTRTQDGGPVAHQTTRYGDTHPVMVAAHMFWFYDGTGVALGNDWWGGTVQYYAFGCQHEYTELGAKECRERGITHWGRCWHVYECSKCGHIDAHDSSD